MAKTLDKERAYRMYVKEHRTAKEVSKRTGVTEKTIGIWVKKHGWKKQRNAEVNSAKAQQNRINEILGEYAEQTLYYIQENKKLKVKISNAIANNNTDALKIFSEQLNDNNSELARIDDGSSKWRKQLTDLDKENRISLSVYLEVMDDLFENMRAFDDKLYSNSLDFQEKHLTTISIKLG